MKLTLLKEENGFTKEQNKKIMRVVKCLIKNSYNVGSFDNQSNPDIINIVGINTLVKQVNIGNIGVELYGRLFEKA